MRKGKGGRRGRREERERKRKKKKHCDSSSILGSVLVTLQGSKEAVGIVSIRNWFSWESKRDSLKSG